VEVYACASHGVLSGPALERIENSVIKEMIFLDTIPLPENCNRDIIKQLTVAPLFAEAIERIYERISVSTLFCIYGYLQTEVRA
jgi:ribose-phosphate pyrophosphokinase